MLTFRHSAWVGTLDGFSFDSDDESDNLPKATTNQNDQNEGVEEQHNGKGKGKGKAEKKSVSQVT